MRLGQFVRSGVAHPLRDEAKADVTTEPIGAIAGDADDGIGTEEVDPADAVRHDLLDEHAG